MPSSAEQSGLRNSEPCNGKTRPSRLAVVVTVLCAGLLLIPNLSFAQHPTKGGPKCTPTIFENPSGKPTPFGNVPDQNGPNAAMFVTGRKLLWGNGCWPVFGAGFLEANEGQQLRLSLFISRLPQHHQWWLLT